MVGSPPEGAASRTHTVLAETARKRRLARHRMEKRRFRIAFVLALLFHLSMITIFQIVIYFPRNDTQYYTINLVSSPSVAPNTTEKSSDTLSLGGAAELQGLPAVDLPVIEFAEIDRLRIRYGAADPLPDMDRFFGTADTRDSWSRFGGDLQKIGRSLRNLALSGEDAPFSEPLGKSKRMLLHSPAEGFQAYIEWSGPPYDRELLFAPPVKALWNLNPMQLKRPLEIVFKVNASGRVTNVWSPTIENSELTDDVQMTLLQYRFAPLSSDAGGNSTGASAEDSEQSGVFFIQAAGDAP